MEEPRFREFGLSFVAVDKLFVCTRNRDGSAVRAWSEQGGPADLEGDDARELVVYLRGRRIAAEAPGSTLVIGPQWAPFPDGPTRSEPGPAPMKAEPG